MAPAEMLRGEHDENEVRKEFTLSERVRGPTPTATRVLARAARRFGALT
ncbi:MAG: hypothetical protein R6X29_04300 [Acidimicrobiia bacterium]|jgi:hypothetical protein